jgi:hypothetical protein
MATRNPTYGSRWRARALADTWQYWTPTKTAVQLAGPIIVGIAWAVFKPWAGWWAVMQVALISVLGFFALWGVVFCVELILAPGKLHEKQLVESASAIEVKQMHLHNLGQQKAREIADLVRNHATEISKRLTEIAEVNSALIKCREDLAIQNPVDVLQERLVESAIGKLDGPEREFVTWLASMGSADNADISRAGHHDTVPNRVIGKTVPVNLIKRIPYTPGNGLVEMGFRCEINPELKTALRNVLFR